MIYLFKDHIIKNFGKNYNVLLESEEEKKLGEDLSKRAILFRE